MNEVILFNNGEREINCPGNQQIKAVEQRTDYSQNPSAMEGITFHELVEKCWLAGVPAATYANVPLSTGLLVDDEMASHAQWLLDKMTSWRNIGYTIEMEFETSIPALIPTRGRVDIVGLHDSLPTLVGEIKYGHKFVAVDRWQLKLPAIALQLRRQAPVTMFVYQPRCFTAESFRTMELTLADIQNITGEFERVIKLRSTGKTHITTGAWCYKCPRMIHCPKSSEATSHLVDFSGEPETFAPSPEQLALEHATVELALERLKNRYSALTEHIKEEIKANKIIPGYQIERGTGNRKFKDVKAVKSVGELYGIEIRKSVMKSPTELEKDIPKEIFRQLVGKPLTGEKLKRVDINQYFKGIYHE